MWSATLRTALRAGHVLVSGSVSSSPRGSMWPWARQQAHVQSCGREGPSAPGWGAEDPAHGCQIHPQAENRGEALGCVQGKLEGAEAAWETGR